MYQSLHLILIHMYKIDIKRDMTLVWVSTSQEVLIGVIFQMMRTFKVRPCESTNFSICLVINLTFKSRHNCDWQVNSSKYAKLVVSHNKHNICSYFMMIAEIQKNRCKAVNFLLIMILLLLQQSEITYYSQYLRVQD